MPSIVSKPVSGAPGRGANSVPFLSVIMRTQARRLAAMRDALLSLAGQTDQDFELVVVLHANASAAEADFAAVRALVERYQPLYDREVRIVTATGGKRGHPLNVGVAEARGEYVCFFDDDDLLFGNWVESYRHIDAPGQLRRLSCAVQRVASEAWPGETGFRATTWPLAAYPETFSVVDHLGVNNTPFMCVAFPREFFFADGFRFDEQLDVCEDWDAILTGAVTRGVGSTAHLGAIYRMWSGVETSYSTHHRAEWQRSERRVIEKLNARPLRLAAGEAEALHQRLLFVEQAGGVRFMFSETGLRRPFRAVLRIVSPGIRLAVWLRNSARRIRHRLATRRG